jgi:hypothetical protein
MARASRLRLTGTDGTGDGSGSGVTVLEHVTALLAEMNLRLQQRFDAQTTAIAAALLAQKEAVEKAEVAADKRFELLNELRVGVATTEQVDALDKRINELTARIDRMDGHSSGLNAGWGILTGAAGLIAAAIAIVVGLA